MKNNDPYKEDFVNASNKRNSVVLPVYGKATNLKQNSSSPKSKLLRKKNKRASSAIPKYEQADKRSSLDIPVYNKDNKPSNAKKASPSTNKRVSVDTPEYDSTALRKSIELPDYGKPTVQRQNDIKISSLFREEGKRSSVAPPKYEQTNKRLSTALPTYGKSKTNEQNKNDFQDSPNISDISQDLVAAIVNQTQSNPSPEAVTQKSKNSNNQLSSKREAVEEYFKKICKKVTLVRLPYEKEIAFYTGTYYKIIPTPDDLMEMVKEKVSPSAFNSTTLAEFPPLFKFLIRERRIDIKDYSERVKKSKYLVTLRNGIYDCISEELMPFSSDILTFFQLEANYIRNPKPKYFLKVLETWFGEDESVKMLLIESLGYIFSGINEGKKFFIFGTARDSGKSILSKFVETIIGEDYVDYMELENFSQRFGLGGIGNKVLIICPDIEDGMLKPAMVAKIKQSTGGDKMSTELKFVQRKKTSSNTRILLVTNSPIRLSSKTDDPAFWRRMIIIPFLNSVDDDSMDFNLLDNLLEERDEIVSFCLKAVSSLIKRRYKFTECLTSEDLKNQWHYGVYDMTDSLQPFTEKYIEITCNPNDEVFLQELKVLYEKFCKNEGYKTVSYPFIKKWYEDKGCRHKRIHHNSGENARTGLVGLKFKEQPSSNI